MRSSLFLHGAYGDHMVLQRCKPIRIAGTATVGSCVSGIFLGHKASTVTGNDGEWLLEFPPAEAGGPYDLLIQGDCHTHSRILLRDILVGDVWFCSGQSNMEFPVWGEDEFFRLRDGKEVAASAHDNRLRLLQVPFGVDPDSPCTEPPGRPVWKTATTPEAVEEFSAVGYWFGKRLRESLADDVPIGLVNSSWGGSRIEPWIPEWAYAKAGRKDELSSVAAARAMLFDSPGDDGLLTCGEKAFRRLRDWVENKFLTTDPATSAEALAHWATPESGVDPAWQRGPFYSLSVIDKPGAFWLRREFDVPAEWADRRAVVRIGVVDDSDETFLDGEKIGATGLGIPNYWAVERQYPVTLRANNAGRHVLAVRVMDHFRTGFMRAPVELLVEGEEPIDLACGEWMRRDEFTADIDAIGLRPPVPGAGPDSRHSCQTPTTLYNSMVHPFESMNIRGIVWYQGCGNFDDAPDYLVLSRLWIDAWRRIWRDDALPFLVTQLAAYAEHHPEIRLSDDFWRDDTPDSRPGFAPLRDVQARLFDEDPFVGLACAIDIGDHSDIHPANKKDIGIRLANEALRIAYSRADALPGPRLDTAKREGAAMRVRFRDTGDGLTADTGIGPHLFAVAGADKCFAWAEARLDPDGTVLAWSPDVPEPVFIRYAWSAFPPGVTLRRKGDGLPVFPFATAR